MYTFAYMYVLTMIQKDQSIFFKLDLFCRKKATCVGRFFPFFVSLHFFVFFFSFPFFLLALKKIGRSVKMCVTVVFNVVETSYV